jgi:hypothetical protein
LLQILGTNVGYFIENTTVDLDERRLELNSENITFSHLLRLQEQCVYVPAPNNPDTETLFTQTARGMQLRFCAVLRARRRKKFIKHSDRFSVRSGVGDGIHVLAKLQSERCER